MQQGKQLEGSEPRKQLRGAWKLEGIEERSQKSKQMRII